MGTIYLSYQKKDVRIAEKVHKYLESQNLDCYFPTLSTRFDEMILMDEIERATIFILIFSTNSSISQDILKEVETAVKNDLLVIPVKVDSTLPTGGLSYYLSAIHWIDMVDGLTEFKLKELFLKVNAALKNESYILNKSDYSDTIMRRRRFKSVSLYITLTFFSIIMVFVSLFIIETYYKSDYYDNLPSHPYSSDSVFVSEIEKLIATHYDVYDNLVWTTDNSRLILNNEKILFNDKLDYSFLLGDTEFLLLNYTQHKVFPIRRFELSTMRYYGSYLELRVNDFIIWAPINNNENNILVFDSTGYLMMEEHTYFLTRNIPVFEISSDFNILHLNYMEDDIYFLPISEYGELFGDYNVFFNSKKYDFNKGLQDIIPDAD